MLLTDTSKALLTSRYQGLPTRSEREQERSMHLEKLQQGHTSYLLKLVKEEEALRKKKHK
jgi:hypothetical protein